MQKLCAIIAVMIGLALLVSCSESSQDASVRKIVYWEKWTGFEGEAMDRVVEAFNKRERTKAEADPSYKPIEVKKVTTSRISEKLLVAIAGGNPPDVAGFYSAILSSYVDKGALEDLTPFLSEADIDQSNYVKPFWDMCQYHGKTWALPTTPATVALHWNKRLFREAGLDPQTAPKTIEEMDAFAEKMTKWEVTLANGQTEIRTGFCEDIEDGKKNLIQVGFLPAEPGWWNHAWGFHFGGTLMEGHDTVTANHPNNIKAYEWVASYSKKLGVRNIQRFRSGFGNFSSPQNPFMSGQVAMEIQGVWMYNFVEKYSPGMQWGAAPFPHPAGTDLANCSLVEADLIIIPKDSKHPKEAFEFIKYVNSQEGMELLCAGQKKFSPLAKVSDQFWAEHPHPYIKLFRSLAMSPNAYSLPKSGVWDEYKREMSVAYDKIQNLSATPKEALDEVQSRMEASVARNLKMLKRRGLNE